MSRGGLEGGGMVLQVAGAVPAPAHSLTGGVHCLEERGVDRTVKPETATPFFTAVRAANSLKQPQNAPNTSSDTM